MADFQHQVLRPLLKFQNSLLLATVADFAADYHLPLATADPTETKRLLTELLTPQRAPAGHHCGPGRGPRSPPRSWLSTVSTAPS
ncbi:MAG: hypothetical protein WKG07_25585 [Hymenobacter sp.]